MKKTFPRGLLAAAVAAGALLAPIVPTAPAAALPVFDATNYAQNLLQAARALQQIQQQVQQLQNEATMIQNMARNLERLDFSALARLDANFRRVDQLMGEARSIGFEVGQLDSRFRTLFPGRAGEALARDGRIAAAQARFDSVREALAHTLGVQAQVVENVRSDAGLLGQLVERSQGATGALQVQQATNQLLALAAQQQFQLQAMMASQFQGDAIERARRLQAESDARAATRRFLGTGRAYTPR